MLQFNVLCECGGLPYVGKVTNRSVRSANLTEDSTTGRMHHRRLQMLQYCKRPEWILRDPEMTIPFLARCAHKISMDFLDDSIPCKVCS